MAQWVADLRKVAGEIPIVVAGNKVDLPNRQVKAQEGSVMMRKLKARRDDQEGPSNGKDVQKNGFF